MDNNWIEGKRHNMLIVDGSWKKNDKSDKDPGDAAYGWVIRTGNEEVASGGQKIEASSPGQAEAYAILFGIKECRDRDIKNVEVWTDAEKIVASLKDKTKTTPVTRNIVLEINLELLNFESYSIIKVAREKIQKAHLLANLARRRACSF